MPKDYVPCLLNKKQQQTVTKFIWLGDVIVVADIISTFALKNYLISLNIFSLNDAGLPASFLKTAENYISLFTFSEKKYFAIIIKKCHLLLSHFL